MEETFISRPIQAKFQTQASNIVCDPDQLVGEVLHSQSGRVVHLQATTAHCPGTEGPTAGRGLEAHLYPIYHGCGLSGDHGSDESQQHECLQRPYRVAVGSANAVVPGSPVVFTMSSPSILSDLW